MVPYVCPTFTQIPYARLLILATPEFDSEEIGAEEAACLAFQTDRVSKFGQPPKSESMTCYFCYRTGHVWSKCNWLQHIPESEKDAILTRRKQYYARGMPRSPRPLPAAI